MVFCANCGKQIPENLKFCSFCGASTTKTQNVDDDEAKKMKNDRYLDLVKRVKFYKPLWDKSGVIQFKSDFIAILQRRYGSQVEFIIAFEDLTKEGYKLMAIDEGKESSISDGGINSYYYFQKLDKEIEGKLTP
jgi:zinc-ribbon domain